METGELLTRATVWLALGLYVGSELVKVVRANRGANALAWWLNAAGCGFFLAHVGFAFQHFYQWSHAVAYADTVRQTRELTGWNFGGGLYINYIFALVWIGEVLRARLWQSSEARKSIVWCIRGFFLFMIFNGAFVFVRGHIRWFGLFLCILLVGGWCLELKRRIDLRRASKSS